MSRTILREPGQVRPWEQEPLRPVTPKNGSSVLADLTGASEPAPSGMLRPEGHGSDTREQVPGAAAEAEQLLRQAHDEADHLRTAAVREGYADGQARALEERAEEQQRLRELLAGIGEAYRSFCLHQVPELAALAAAAAEKLLYEQLTLEPERVLVIVQQAIEQVVGTAPITVHLNPADVALVRGHLMRHAREERGMRNEERGQSRNEERGTRNEKDPVVPVLIPRSSFLIPHSSSLIPALELAPDPAVEPGGCWIESDHGEVDATVSGRLSRLKELFSQERGTRNEE